MAIEHARPGQAVDVKPFLAQTLTSAVTTALFKSRDLEVMRVVLQAGKSLPPHRVPGELTIQCIEGALQITVAGTVQTLRQGQLLYLLGDAEHSVLALEDASALLTIALKPSS